MTTRIQLEPTPKYGIQIDGVGAVPQTATTRASTAAISVVSGPKGLRYDVGKVADEGRRNRILANRASAKSSRQRRLDEARAMNDNVSRLEDENRALQEANVALKRRITEAQATIEIIKIRTPI